MMELMLKWNKCINWISSSFIYTSLLNACPSIFPLVLCYSAYTPLHPAQKPTPPTPTPDSCLTAAPSYDRHVPLSFIQLHSSETLECLEGQKKEKEEEGWWFQPPAVVTLSITSFNPHYSESPQATNTLASTECKTTQTHLFTSLCAM
ncbi:hypothetical protein NQZ68_004510 [Dissostichus eleginoides]|nr:hypothetical protein NQZ68_004510 [Dissostichus eleginoides]